MMKPNFKNLIPKEEALGKIFNIWHPVSKSRYCHLKCWYIKRRRRLLCEILKERGELIFSGVAAVPGRPMSVSMIDNKPVINMSGPSFATFYSTDWMIQALVYKQLGINMPKRKTVQAKLTEKFTMPPFFSQMARFQVKALEDGSYEATPLAFHGPKITIELTKD